MVMEILLIGLVGLVAVTAIVYLLTRAEPRAKTRDQRIVTGRSRKPTDRK
jgi:hypothetical protein